jgi:hypothetical protein
MPIYRITENNVLIGEYDADLLEILPTGQFVLFKENKSIGVFNQNCSCFSVDDFYKTERELISKEIAEMRKNISEIDKYFCSDIFLKDKTPEEAYDKLRKITGLVCFHSDKLNPNS